MPKPLAPGGCGHHSHGRSLPSSIPGGHGSGWGPAAPGEIHTTNIGRCSKSLFGFLLFFSDCLKLQKWWRKSWKVCHFFRQCTVDSTTARDDVKTNVCLSEGAAPIAGKAARFSHSIDPAHLSRVQTDRHLQPYVSCTVKSLANPTKCSENQLILWHLQQIVLHILLFVDICYTSLIPVKYIFKCACIYHFTIIST